MDTPLAWRSWEWAWGWPYQKTNSQWFPKSEHVGHRSIHVFNECSQRLGSRQRAAADGGVSAAASPYLRMKAPSVWVSTSHLHLNNPFAVNGCTTHNTSFVYGPPRSSVCLSALCLCIFMVTINTIPCSRDTPTWLKGWPLSIENEVFLGNWKKGVNVNCFSL